MTHEITMSELLEAARKADAAWMAEIALAFPKERAGNVRYTAEAHGEHGTPLRAAYDAYRAACHAIGYGA